MKRLVYKVFPSTEETIFVRDETIYGGAHNYHIRNSKGFENGTSVYSETLTHIPFVRKGEDGKMYEGVQDEQLAYVLLDRAVKLNARFPSPQAEKKIEGLRMFIDACEERVRDRIERGVMGELKI